MQKGIINAKNGYISIVKPFFKKMGFILAVMIILIAIISSVFRALTPWAKQYKPLLEQKLSQLIGQPVSIEHLETGWYRFEPVVKMKNITIQQANKNTLDLKTLFVGIDLFSSLWHWQIQPGILYVEKAHFDIYETGKRWHLQGLPINLNQSRLNAASPKELVSWLALQQKMIFKNVSFSINYANGEKIPVKELNLSVINDHENYKIKGLASLDQKTKTTINLLAELNLNPYDIHESNGEIYIDFNNALPRQLQLFAPKTDWYFSSGTADISMWLNLKNGMINSVQSLLKLHKLSLKRPGKESKLLFQVMEGNVSWQLTDKGWELKGDQIYIQNRNKKTQANQFLISHNDTEQTDKYYIQSLNIERIFAQLAPWFPKLEKYKELNLHGRINDIQIHTKNNHLNYLLARFNKMGWKRYEKIPGINHLSGALYWQPGNGYVEIDSKNTLIDFAGIPAQTFAIVNGAFEWKKLSHGIRLSIDRLVMSHPQLTLSTQGVFDKFWDTSSDQLNLVTQFTAKNLQNWLIYLPKSYLKPNLVKWLQNDIKKIAKSSGKITINGKLAHFPFDKYTGEFKISSYLSGIDLRVNKKWPYFHDIDAYLRVNKRDLDVDIVHADINSVILREMNLKINDIGYDQEELLIHSKVKGLANKIIDFVLHSPLKKKLSMLNTLTIDGSMGLDLNLQIPLYPGNKHISALGSVNFKDNYISFQHPIGKLNLQDLSGSLYFNEYGVTKSKFKAQALGYPFSMSLHSVKHPNPYTAVDMHSQITVEELRRQYQLPLLDYLSGSFSAYTQLQLTDDPNDLDRMRIQSSLKGLAINLPSPLNKTANQKRELKLDIGFNPKKAIHLRANLANLLSTDLWFEDKKGSFSYPVGELRLGSGNAMKHRKSGIRVVGSISEFDYNQWVPVINGIEGRAGNHSITEHLNYIDINIKKLVFLKRIFNRVFLKATKLKTDIWSVYINQLKMKAKLKYSMKKNALSGYIQHLRIDLPKNKEHAAPSNTFQPNKLPNLDLYIHDLQVGTFHLGEMKFKSKSAVNHLSLQYCKIRTPSYQMELQAEWFHKAKADKTELQARLFISDLAGSLKRFDIEPVVEAKQGIVNFTGGWNHSLFDFSLDDLKGMMDINLKNGRITHLSQETEEKLGLGKLLSILSLQTIPRRLKLDFSDLSQKGYSFDIFKGRFNLADGKMVTKNSYIDGPVAYAGMKGLLNLSKQTYDLELKISPHITASLPIVATIAGGPVAGIAAWIASTIIHKGMQKISAYTYKITGPWDKPVVQQVSIVKRH